MAETAGRPASVLLAVAAGALLVLLWALRDVVMLVAFALLLAHALDPVVTAIQRTPLPRRARVPRSFAAGIVIVLLVAVIVVFVSLGTPRLVSELGGFIQRAPTGIERFVAGLRVWAAERQLTEYVEPVIDGLRQNTSGMVQSGGGLVLGWIGKLFGGVAQLLGLAVLPVLSFYLLAQREAVEGSVLRFVPAEGHARALEMVALVDRALKSYVRGQLVVCVIMGIAISVALALMGFPFALLLGVLAGLAEAIPFLGAFVATIAIAIAGYSVTPWLALWGALAYVAINNASALLVTPRVMGRHLKMHPFVVTVSILAGAALLGPPGALLALPGAAVLQAVAQFYARRGEEESGGA